MSDEKLGSSKPKVAIIMGSQSDWPTMRLTAEILQEFSIPFEASVVSAHRTPELLYDWARSADEKGFQVVIAAAGGAAHLPGMTASMTHLPVLGVPIKSSTLQGVDSLLSIVQMPTGIPVGTLAIGQAGAKNAALLAASILATSDDKIREALKAYRAKQTAKVMASRELSLDEE
jgi:5-(carboxyamino)imidazole ribonucleotide mutase